jgi:hypothetical protein
LTTGYDVLESTNRYDLIILDPYAEFWNERATILTKIGRKAQDSSILLFLPFEV